ncbi:MAG TPA: energy transducer TonB [Bacteroidota bacterium]|nr:energy transducer TonB [Bacteroidota bacterium]
MILDKFKYPFLSRMRRPEGLPPKFERNPKVDLGASPATVFEASFSLSLLTVIGAFIFFPEVHPPQKISIRPQELVKFEDIENTRQENRPPPPPRPPIPIEAPGDEVMDDILLRDSELNVSEEVAPPAPKVEEEEEYFVAVEEMPEIIGGMEALMRNLVYPELAVRAGVQGRVFVVAYINEKGEVTRAEVAKGIGAGCDESAVEAVKKAKFIPGRQRGKPVKVRLSIAVRFQLSK